MRRAAKADNADDFMKAQLGLCDLMTRHTVWMMQQYFMSVGTIIGRFADAVESHFTMPR